MSTVVLKFGGTSVASLARLRTAARRIAAHVRAGRRVVAVVSAGGDSTDRILDRIARIGAPRRDCTIVELDAGAGRGREVDRALATGEDRSAALLAVALWRTGLPARSLRGGDAGVQAEGGFGGGRISAVDPAPLRRLLETGIVPVVSGYQGERYDGETVTLGRGGSDISAVAIAAALGAVCHIVTDVDAVYDRDPRRHADACPLASIDHATLVRLTERGARVVHPVAARVAADHAVPLVVYHHRAPISGTGTRVGAPEPVAAGQGGAA